VKILFELDTISMILSFLYMIIISVGYSSLSPTPSPSPPPSFVPLALFSVSA
jgi:hypothetical protein